MKPKKSTMPVGLAYGPNNSRKTSFTNGRSSVQNLDKGHRLNFGNKDNNPSDLYMS